MRNGWKLMSEEKKPAEQSNRQTAQQAAPQTNKAELTTIEFYGDTIVAIYDKGKVWVAVRPIVENLGLNWSKQYRKILADPVLSSTVAQKATVAQDGKERKLLCLPVEYLNGFLFKINPNKVKDERVRERIIRYQKECYKALYEYFFQGVAINKRFFEDVEAIKEELQRARKRIEIMEFFISDLWRKKQLKKFQQIPKREPLQNLRKYNPNWPYIRADLHLWLCKGYKISEIQKFLFKKWEVLVSDSALRRYRLWWKHHESAFNSCR